MRTICLGWAQVERAERVLELSQRLLWLGGGAGGGSGGGGGGVGGMLGEVEEVLRGKQPQRRHLMSASARTQLCVVRWCVCVRRATSGQSSVEPSAVE
jgi:hypothetical protein